MHISKIKLHNFKGFKGDHEIVFERGVDFLVGDNNCGKTSVFEAIDFIRSKKERDEIVGSIGLQKLNIETGIMRKFFVKKELRGIYPSVAALLFHQFIQQAKDLKLKNIFLDTPAVAVASHRFYEKNGFVLINDYKILPNGYSFSDRNSKFYCLSL